LRDTVDPPLLLAVEDSALPLPPPGDGGTRVLLPLPPPPEPKMAAAWLGKKWVGMAACAAAAAMRGGVVV